MEIIDFSIIQEGIFKIFGGELAPEDKLQNIAGFLLSQPVLRELEHILYTPTQIISDYIKSKGYDGICFASSVTNVGENYVFFDKKVVNFKDDASITVKINGVA